MPGYGWDDDYEGNFGNKWDSGRGWDAYQPRVHTFRTKPPKTYLPPTISEIRMAAKDNGIEQFDPAMVEDLCNMDAGGESLPSSTWKPYLYGEGMRNSWGQFSGRSNAERSKGRQDYLNNYVSSKTQYHENVVNFASTIKGAQVPGASPLQRAMNLLKLMKEQEEKHDSQPSHKTADQLNQILKDIAGMSKEEKSLMWHSEDKESEQSMMDMAMDMVRGKNLWLQVSRKLDGMTKLRTIKGCKPTPDPEGEDSRSRPIENPGEMARLAKPEWGYPELYRMWRVMSRVATVRERVSRIEKMQLLYMIVDCSGSMQQSNRQARACGVLMNRLKAVMREEARLYFRFFSTGLHSEHFIQTKAEARTFLEILQRNGMGGGGTAIDNCLRQAHLRIEQILAEGNLIRPELVIVTDGADHVNLKAHEIKGTTLHAFVVQSENQALTRLARATGGVGINSL